MTKQGIITGIGNTITPQIDAVLNDFIVGRNAIISGLSLTNGTLTAGMCQLCGYRGVLEQSVPVSDNYIFGKFVINFGNGEDTFSIFTSSTEPTDGIINPTSITTNGTYYLRLYTNGMMDNSLVSDYPYSANTSERSMQLIANGIILSTATTPTEKDDKGNVVVDLHNSQPARVANTEYVHNQIVEELNEGTITFDLVGADGYGGTKTYGTMSIQRRAKYCIATLTFSQDIAVYRGTLSLGNMPNGYIPNKTVLSSIGVSYYDNLKTGQIKLDNAITLVNIPYDGDNESTSYLRGYVSKGTYQIGYECQ